MKYIHVFHPSGSLRSFKFDPVEFVELGVLESGSGSAIYKKNPREAGSFVDGAPGEIRTPDHLVRSQILYPTELRALVRLRRIYRVLVDINLNFTFFLDGYRRSGLSFRT